MKLGDRWVVFVVDPRCDTSAWDARRWDAYFYRSLPLVRLHDTERQAHAAVRRLLEGGTFKALEQTKKPIYGVARIANVTADGINLEARIDGVDAVGVFRALTAKVKGVRYGK